jgi:hypothetical protein
VTVVARPRNRDVFRPAAHPPMHGIDLVRSRDVNGG